MTSPHSKIVSLKNRRVPLDAKGIALAALGVFVSCFLILAGTRMYLWWSTFLAGTNGTVTLWLTLTVTLRWMAVLIAVLATFGAVTLCLHATRLRLTPMGLALSMGSAFAWTLAGPVLVAWEEMKKIPSIKAFGTSILAGLIAFNLMKLGSHIFVYAKRTMVRDADDVLKRDTRAPILLLRSFVFDEQVAAVSGGFDSHQPALTRRVSNFSFWADRREWKQEEVICHALFRRGPVVAIGAPGETLPQLGGARKYVNDVNWKSEVLALANQALAILVVIGETAGLLWELEQLLSNEKTREKTILIIPSGPGATTWKAFFLYIEQRYDPGSLPPEIPDDAVAVSMRSLLEPLVFIGRSTAGNYLEVLDTLVQRNHGSRLGTQGL